MKKILMTSCMCLTPVVSPAQDYSLVDAGSNVMHGAINFTDQEAVMSLLPRWCSHDSRDCSPTSRLLPTVLHDIAFGQEPVTFDLDDKTQMVLGEGMVKFLTKTPHSSVARSFVLRPTGDDSVMSLPENHPAPARVVHLSDGAEKSLRVVFPQNSSSNGAVLAVRDESCDSGAPDCLQFTLELDDVLDHWLTDEQRQEVVRDGLRITLDHDVQGPVASLETDGQMVEFSPIAAAVPGQKPAASVSQTGSMPVGVYAWIGDETLQSVGDLGESFCQVAPSVFRPDGVILFKSMDSPPAGSLFGVDQYFDCATGDCIIHQGTPEAPNPVMTVPAFSFEPLENGHYQACTADGGRCQLVYSCIRPGGEVDAKTLAPDGTPLMAHLISDWTGGSAGFHYDASNALVIE